MTEPDNKPAATEPRETQQSGLASLNARTAKRQQLLLAGVGAVLLSGASWFIFGSDDSADGADPNTTPAHQPRKSFTQRTSYQRRHSLGASERSQAHRLFRFPVQLLPQIIG